MPVSFPTDTTAIPVITIDDQLLIADDTDSDASKDVTLAAMLTFIAVQLRSENACVPEPAVETQMLVADASNNWALASSFNAGEY